MEKISVITVCYNAASTLEKTILSVLNQTYPNIEYIIIDGGSTDGSVDIIRKYADQLAYWVSEPDKGIYDAMNKGIDCCNGEWINFMNAGDTFYADNTISLLGKYLGDCTAGIIYGDTNCIFDWGEKICRALPLEMMKDRIVFSHQASFVKRTIMQKYKFDVNYKIVSDYKFFYERFLEGEKFFYIPICITNYDTVSGISISYFLEGLKETARFKGHSQNWNWRIYFYVRCVYVRLSTMIKYILPKKIVTKIRKYKSLKK